MNQELTIEEKKFLDNIARNMAEKILSEKKELKEQLMAFAYFNDMENIAAYKYSEEEIMIRAEKKIEHLTERELPLLRKMLINEIKKIYMPYVGGKKIRAVIKFT